MGRRTCPSCGKAIRDRFPAIVAPNLSYRCDSCGKEGCGSCFYKKSRVRDRVIYSDDPGSLSFCTEDCCVIYYYSKDDRRPPSQEIRNKVRELKGRRLDRTKELAKLYLLKMSEEQRSFIRKCAMDNKYRIEMWGIHDPFYHKDALDLKGFESLNLLMEEWGLGKLTREDVIVLFQIWNMNEKLARASILRTKVDGGTDLDRAVRTYLDLSIGGTEESITTFGSRLAGADDPIQDPLIYMYYFTMWTFLLILYGKDVPFERIDRYHRDYIEGRGFSLERAK